MSRLMIHSLNVLSMLAVVAAGGILAHCADEWFRPDSAAQQSAGQEGAVQTFIQNLAKAPGDDRTSSPLVAQAQAFASYLNPPAVSVRETAPQEILKPAPVVRPADPSPKFKVLGTSCFADDPKRSMVLIQEPGAADNSQWVKEGTQIGHFTIHEIRPGSVVYMAGEKLCEMAVEEQATTDAATVADSNQPSPSSPQTAMNDSRPPSPAGPPKRPTRSSGPTVGSARTAALN